jgi:hypothetical protein
MAVEVALAMLQRDGRWLMQLRDEIPSIRARRRSRACVGSCWRRSAGSPQPLNR